MPYLVGIIISALSSFVVRLLLSLGIGFMTYNVVLPNIISFIVNKISLLPPVAYQTLGILRFDICVTIIVSAYAANTLSRVFITKLSR